MNIELTISAMPDGSEQLSGFQYVWLMYVNDFKPEKHCQACLKGKRDEEFGKLMKINRTILLRDPAKYKHIYLCGEPIKKFVKHLPRSNGKYPYPGLHLALQPEEGATASIESYNGIQISVTNVRQLEIPKLDDLYAGRGHEYTSCCVWQFGVAHYNHHLIPG